MAQLPVTFKITRDFFGSKKLTWHRIAAMLEVRNSLIPGAGLGLFSSDRFLRGDEVVGFENQAVLRTQKTYLKRKQKYYQTGNWDASPMEIITEDNYPPPFHDFFIEDPTTHFLYYDKDATAERSLDLNLDVMLRVPLWYRLNHSNHPNVLLTKNPKGKIVWVALRTILRNEELTFEYEPGFQF